jgi:hypothetical protein
MILKYDSQLKLKHKQLYLETNYNKIDWYNILQLEAVIDEKDKILIILLTNSKTLTTNQIANEMYISKSKVEKLIKTINILPLEWNNKRNNGISIKGTNIDKYIKLTDIIIHYTDDLNYLQTTNLIFKKLINYKYSEDEYGKIKIMHDNYMNIFNIKNEFEIKKNFIFMLVIAYFKENIPKFYLAYHHKTTNNNIHITEIKNKIDNILTCNNIEFKENDIIYLHLLDLINSSINPNKNNYQITTDTQTNFLHANLITKQINQAINNTNHFNNNLITIYIQILINKSLKKQLKLSINIITQYTSCIVEYIIQKLSQHLNGNLNFIQYPIKDVINQRQMKGDITITTLYNLELNNCFYINPIPNDEEIIQLALKINLQTKLIKVQNLIDDNTNYIYKTLNYKQLLRLINHQIIKNQHIMITSEINIVNNNAFLTIKTSEIIVNKIIIILVDHNLKINKQHINIVFIILINENNSKEDIHLINDIQQILLDEQRLKQLKTTYNIKQFKQTITKP